MVNQHGDGKKIRTSVVIRPKNRLRIEEMAQEEQRSVSHMIDILLDEAIEIRDRNKEGGEK